jgi:hypothetical protein
MTEGLVPSHTSAGHHAARIADDPDQARFDETERQESSSGPSLARRSHGGRRRERPLGPRVDTTENPVHGGARRSVPQGAHGFGRDLRGEFRGDVQAAFTQASRRGPSGGNGHPPTAHPRSGAQRLGCATGSARPANARASGTPFSLLAETRRTRVPIVPSGSEAHAMIQHERITFNDLHGVEPAVRAPGYRSEEPPAAIAPYRTTDETRPPPQHPRSDPRAAASLPLAGVVPRS